MDFRNEIHFFLYVNLCLERNYLGIINMIKPLTYTI